VWPPTPPNQPLCDNPEQLVEGGKALGPVYEYLKAEGPKLFVYS